MDLRVLIKTELLKKHMPIGEFVEKLGISRQALNVKLRRNDMKISTIEKMADILDCTVSLSFIPKTPSTQSDSQ